MATLTQAADRAHHSARLRKSPTSKQWLAVKSRIWYLYCEQGLRLKDVMAIMKQECQFDATAKMYKSRIATWGLRKNNLRVEARIMLHRKRALEKLGKNCMFIVRGRLVDISDLERSYKRDSPTLDDCGSPLPEGIQCIIVEGEPSKALEISSMKYLRSFLHHCTVHRDVCYDRLLWYSVSPDQKITSDTLEDEVIVNRCLVDLADATYFFTKGRHDLGGALVRRSTRSFPQLLEIPNVGLLWVLIMQLKDMDCQKLPELKEAVIASIDHIATAILPPSHPFITMFRAMRLMNLQSLQILADIVHLESLDCHRQRLASEHYELIWLETRSPPRDSDASWADIHADVSKADRKFGATSQRSLHILHYHCLRFLDTVKQDRLQNIYDDFQLRQLENLWQKLVQRWDHLASSKSLDYRSLAIGQARLALSEVQELRGRYTDARSTCLQGLEKDTTGCSMRLHERLERLCDHLGLSEEAERHRIEQERWAVSILEDDHEQLRRDEILTS